MACRQSQWIQWFGGGKNAWLTPPTTTTSTMVWLLVQWECSSIEKREPSRWFIHLQGNHTHKQTNTKTVKVHTSFLHASTQNPIGQECVWLSSPRSFGNGRTSVQMINWQSTDWSGQARSHSLALSCHRAKLNPKVKCAESTEKKQESTTGKRVGESYMKLNRTKLRASIAGEESVFSSGKLCFSEAWSGQAGLLARLRWLRVRQLGEAKFLNNQKTTTTLHCRSKGHRKTYPVRTGQNGCQDFADRWPERTKRRSKNARMLSSPFQVERLSYHNFACIKRKVGD